MVVIVLLYSHSVKNGLCTELMLALSLGNLLFFGHAIKRHTWCASSKIAWQMQ